MTKPNDAKRREIETYDTRPEADRRPHGSLWDEESMTHLQELGAERRWQELLDIHATNGPVLDIGCGTGELVAELLERNDGRPVLGVDISVEQLRQTPETAVGHVFTGDADRLPVPDDTFAAVTARAALHHLPNLNEALREIDRVLKPDGTLLFHEPGALNPLAILRRRLLPSDAHTPDEQPFRLDDLRTTLGRYFSSVEVRSYYLVSHTVPVVDNLAPVEVPNTVAEKLYCLEQYLPAGDRFAWIFVGVAE